MYISKGNTSYNGDVPYHLKQQCFYIVSLYIARMQALHSEMKMYYALIYLPRRIRNISKKNEIRNQFYKLYYKALFGKGWKHDIHVSTSCLLKIRHVPTTINCREPGG